MAAASSSGLSRRELLKVLNAALTVEARSALAYGMLVGDTVETGLSEDQWERMATIRSQLSKNAGDLATRIYSAGGTPDPGHFPFVATNYNFLNADVMLARVEPTVPGDIAALDKLATEHSGGELGELLKGLAATKREQHKVVQAILAELNPAPEPEPAPEPDAAAGDAGAPATSE
jgi:hypothetical protein